MKVFISADIEGVTGVTVWNEADHEKEEYKVFAAQMTREVKAACTGATKAGATEIWVRDAHDTARNIDARELPRHAKLVRGWSGHPLGMVDGLDQTFDALLFVGYHSAAGSHHNPLAHTMSGKPRYIKINDELVSEFLLYAYAAASLGVPVAFLSGDRGLCENARRINQHIGTVAVKEGVGAATVNIHPDLAVELIEGQVEQSLGGDRSAALVKLPERFRLEIGYASHKDAYAASFYPGAKALSPDTLAYETGRYFDVLVALKFLL